MQKSQAKQRRINRNLRYTPNDLFTQDEVLELINACNHPRDKALIAILYDALRPHEALKLKLGDIQFHENYALASIPEDTKTGSRTIPLIFSYTYLRDWINTHPLKNDNNSPVFVRYYGLFRSEKLKRHYKPAIHYMNIYLLFNRLKARLNHKLNKRYWNPYVLRHSKLTEYATSVSDQVLKNYAGWTPNSGMASRYVHLSGKHVTPAILAHHGLAKIENKPQETSKLCPRCKHINQLNNKYCDKCSLALSVEAVEEMQQKDKDKDQEIAKLNTKIEKQNTKLAKHDMLLDSLWKESQEKKR